MSEYQYLKLSGGYVRTDMIQWAEWHADVLVVSVKEKPQPIVLRGNDAEMIAAYLDERTYDPLSTKQEKKE